MLWVIVLLEDTQPLTETQLSDTGPYIALQNYLVVFRFHDAMHTVKAEAAKQPQNICEPPPCLTVGTVFFSLKASFSFKQYNNVLYQKALLWSHLST